MSAFVAPDSVPNPAADAFGQCECSHAIYDHGRHKEDGNEIWDGCRIDGCPCSKWQASDGSPWPNVYASATPADPPDLDRNSVHWIDGQVYLTDDEPPL